MRFPYSLALLALAASLSFSQTSVSFAQTSAPTPAQASPQKSAKAVSPEIGNDYVQKEFGSTCKVNPAVAPIKGDFNADGVEDIVIAARCTNPMLDADEHKFEVIDPSNAFYGFGNPKITTQYSTIPPQFRDMAILIVHGAGAEAWHSSTGKAKFLIVNLPYRQIVARKLTLKKKRITAIYVDEAGDSQITSVVYWDGKKYRYEPIGASTD